MVIYKNEIVIKPIQDNDIPLFEKWLNKEYIYKWLCPNGEENREAWMDEVNNRNGDYNFLSHFIVYHNDIKIGYCLYADCFFLKDLEEEGHDFESLYGEVTEQNHTYEIGYLIGEEEYLNKGIGKKIIQILEEKIIELGGYEIAADPSEENIFSIKALISNGFKKKRDGDYRKITVNGMRKLNKNKDMRFNNVRLLVKDYTKSFKFYTEQLGLEPAWGDENSGYASFKVADGIEGLAIFVSDWMAEAIGNTDKQIPVDCREKMMVVLNVDNVDKQYEALKERGIEFINEPHDMPGWGARVVHLYDPENNLIELFAPLSKENWAEDLLQENEKFA